ncbi:hypothetical protein [Clostridioides difficile]|uniref:hypothetical protein n=1 Tax=Clostridioides difficile TaxID=1496 RepID=UPI000D1F4BFB|nr:hypothetical protein [Clostridioides difficile]HBE9444586.1 hypothetical protein [Clostridioides difficile]
MKFNSGTTLDLYQDDLKNKEVIHDMNLKLIPSNLKSNIWKITYFYKTKRGNNKKNHRYVISKDSADAILSFYEYIKNFNDKKPHRAISNVKILDTSYVGQLIQSY